MIIFDTENKFLRKNVVLPDIATNVRLSPFLFGDHSSMQKHSMKNRRIYSYSATVLQKIFNIIGHDCLTTKAREQIWSIRRNKFNIRLIGVKGHSGIKENEMVDEFAKEAAVAQTETPSSYNYAKQLISAIRKYICKINGSLEQGV